MSPGSGTERVGNQALTRAGRQIKQKVDRSTQYTNQIGHIARSMIRVGSSSEKI